MIQYHKRKLCRIWQVFDVVGSLSQQRKGHQIKRRGGQDKNVEWNSIPRYERYLNKCYICHLLSEGLLWYGMNLINIFFRMCKFWTTNEWNATTTGRGARIQKLLQWNVNRCNYCNRCNSVPYNCYLIIFETNNNLQGYNFWREKIGICIY